MIMGAEIAMLVLGFVALVTGKMRLGKGKVVTGPLARYLGMVLLLPVPATLLIKSMVDLSYATKGQLAPDASIDSLWMLAGIEGLLVAACMAAVYAIGWDKAIDPNARPVDLPFAGDLLNRSELNIAEGRFPRTTSADGIAPNPGPERRV
jgi:hypothetical protein